MLAAPALESAALPDMRFLKRLLRRAKLRKLCSAKSNKASNCDAAEGGRDDPLAEGAAQKDADPLKSEAASAAQREQAADDEAEEESFGGASSPRRVFVSEGAGSLKVFSLPRSLREELEVFRRSDCNDGQGDDEGGQREAREVSAFEKESDASGAAANEGALLPPLVPGFGLQWPASLRGDEDALDGELDKGLELFSQPLLLPGSCASSWGWGGLDGVAAAGSGEEAERGEAAAEEAEIFFARSGDVFQRLRDSLSTASLGRPQLKRKAERDLFGGESGEEPETAPLSAASFGGGGSGLLALNGGVAKRRKTLLQTMRGATLRPAAPSWQPDCPFTELTSQVPVSLGWVTCRHVQPHGVDVESAGMGGAEKELQFLRTQGRPSGGGARHL